MQEGCDPIARMALQLSRLPGIGQKSAQRLAYHIISQPEDQVSMMDLTGQQIMAALSAISVETLTPIEAMNELYKLKKMLD